MGRERTNRSPTSTTVAASAVPQTYRFRVRASRPLSNPRADRISPQHWSTPSVRITPPSQDGFIARNQFVETLTDQTSSNAPGRLVYQEPTTFVGSIRRGLYRLLTREFRIPFGKYCSTFGKLSKDRLEPLRCGYS
jgi:hypothetical protein